MKRSVRRRWPHVFLGARPGWYELNVRRQETDEQFRRACSPAGRFFEWRCQYDPDELFQNQFDLHYGASQGSGAHPHVDDAASADNR